MKRFTGWRNRMVAGLVLTVTYAVAEPTVPPSETATCLRAYLHYSLALQTVKQADLLAASRPAEDQAQTLEAATQWQAIQNARLRQYLEKQLGAAARDRFTAFTTGWVDAEQRNDPDYLRQITGATGMTADHYAGLRSAAARAWLAPEMEESAGWLGNVETWLEAGKNSTDRPPLCAWLNREAKPPSPAPPNAGAALEAAEAPAPFVPGMEDDSGSTLDQFATQHREKRAERVARAQEQMQQISDERRAWEEEHGADLKRRADLDAEHVKQQSEKLAAVEKDALEQRKNSWSAKMLNILGSTISTFTGAVTGEVGKRAAEQVTSAIFN